MINNNFEGQDSQTILNEIVLEYTKEQKRERRWRFIKRIFFIIFISWLFYQFFIAQNEERRISFKPHVGLIDVKGEIFDEKSSNGDNFIKSLEKAYSHRALKALIVRIDSPGGSPVQADYMYTSLQTFKQKYPDIKIYGVCVDICTSAAYYIASATDEIYANPASIVGSIGVMYNGFGLVGTIDKLGITRRLLTAGQNKGFMDPFLPVDEKQVADMQVILDIVHQEFIKKVKAGRGDRLKIDANTFSGLVWSGVQAKELGLIDGFASSGQIAREYVKLTDIVDYTYKDSVFDRVAKHMGVALADSLPQALGMKPGLK